MVASVIAKPFDIFAYGVDKTTQVEDKVTTFAKKSFSSIKDIKLKSLKDVPSKIFKFVKENKFNLALTALSLAITAVVFVNISATMAFVFLGAISLVKAYAYTRAYVKSTDYQFRKLAKDYIRSIEELCRNYKNGKQLSNDLVTGNIEMKFNTLQKQLIDFMIDNAKNYNKFQNCTLYLIFLNRNLRLTSDSFPRFAIWKTITDNAFGPSDSITFGAYVFALFKHIKAKDKTYFETELKDLVKDFDPESATLKTDILSKSKTIDSFQKADTKREIALGLYREMTTSPASIIVRSFSDKAKATLSSPIEFVKSLWTPTQN